MREKSNPCIPSSIHDAVNKNGVRFSARVLYNVRKCGVYVHMYHATVTHAEPFVRLVAQELKHAWLHALLQKNPWQSCKNARRHVRCALEKRQGINSGTQEWKNTETLSTGAEDASRMISDAITIQPNHR